MAEVERNDRPWFQVQASIFGSADLQKLNDAQERVFWRLHALCCRRGNGDTINGRPADIAALIAADLRKPVKSVLATFPALEIPGTDGLPLVEVGHNSIRIVKWHDYQPVRTGAERKADSRKAQRREAAARPPRGESATGHGHAARLEAEGELEEELDHTHPPAVRESATPVPSAAVISASSKQIEIRWKAAMDGLGLNIGVGGKDGVSYYVAESLYSKSKSDEEAKAVAAHFAGTLSPGMTKNPSKFVTDYAIRKANWEASKKPQPSAGAKRWCPIHQGIALDGRGNCSNCNLTESARA